VPVKPPPLQFDSIDISFPSKNLTEQEQRERQAKYHSLREKFDPKNKKVLKEPGLQDMTKDQVLQLKDKSSYPPTIHCGYRTEGFGGEIASFGFVTVGDRVVARVQLHASIIRDGRLTQKNKNQ
jgi:hypothetical protein